MRSTSFAWRNAVAAVALTLPVAALAVPVQYRADLGELNDSGVTGTADLSLDEAANELTVNISASGLEAGQPHPQHIHGQFDLRSDPDDAPDSLGSGLPGEIPVESDVPTLAQDADNDGFIEVGEGRATYGTIILPLDSVPGGEFPVADADGDIAFTETYDLLDDALFENPVAGITGFTGDDITPLPLREIVLHGLTVAGDAGEGTGGEVDGSAGYKAALPVAAGEITRAEVPEPGTLALFMAGGVALLMGGVSRRRRPGAAVER